MRPALFGKHPIAAHVSPKKSWEGFAGSVLLQVVVGAWLFVWLLHALVARRHRGSSDVGDGHRR